MTTVHANTGRDAIRRLENMVAMAGLNFPVAAIRQQIASGIHLLAQVARTVGGRRRVTAISEVTGMEGDAVCLQDIFIFRQTGVDARGHATGQHEACGVRPQIMARLQTHGQKLPDSMFQRRILQPVNGAR
jgi:pilus assembly protein CpaF